MKKATGHGHTTTWYKIWQHLKAFMIPIIFCQFQKDPFCLIILYDIMFYFIHKYIAPGQEETTLGDNFKKELCPMILCILFHDFIQVYSPWSGADNHWGQNFDVNRKASWLWSFVASLKKKNSSTSDFIHIFS